MVIPGNCSECIHRGICSAPYYGGNRCRYEQQIGEKTLKKIKASEEKL